MWTHGCDISNWQGIIDWDQLNADPRCEFVWMLTSDGAYYGRPPGAPISISAAFARNRERCKKPKGGYQFLRPHNTDPISMAERFVHDCGPNLELPGMADLEPYEQLNRMSYEEIRDWVGRWLGRVEFLDGRPPVLYVGAIKGWVAYGIQREFSRNPWMLPAYTGNTKANPDPLSLKLPFTGGFRDWDIWQYTSRGRMEGISSFCDCSVMQPGLLSKLISKKRSADMPNVTHIAKATDNSQYVKRLLSVYSGDGIAPVEGAYWFRIVNDDVLTLNQAELNLFRWLAVSEAANFPPEERTIVIADTPLDDVWFTANRYRPRP